MATINTTDPKPGYVYDTDTDTWYPLLGLATQSLEDLTDVVLTSPATNQVLMYNGTNWVNSGETGDITAVTSGTGITVTNGTGPIPTIAIDTATTVDLNTAQTLTNKTLGATTIAGSLIPDTDVAYDLGSSTKKFRDLYLSGSSIKLGGATITATGTSITIGGIDNTPIGSTTRSSGAFTTLTANGAVTFTANTASTTSATGTLVITGGMGISGNITGGGTNTIDGFVVDGGTY